MERRSVALTFDVDLVDWVAGQHVDELNDVVPALLRMLAEIGDVRATFFVRLDDGIARRFGRADYAFEHAREAWKCARAAGHEIAWHHHAVADDAAARDGAERPESDPARLLDGVRRHSAMALDLGCTSARMGWGQHTHQTRAQLAHDGWRVDSSAMPRPVYAWDPPLRDWSRARTTPYLIGSVGSQRAALDSRLHGLWEVPMTMVPLSIDSDTQSDILRYVNPAYRTEVFARAVGFAPVAQPLVLICHPYECVGARQHALYAFSMDTVRANLTDLAADGARWRTISEVVDDVECRQPVEIDAYAA